MNNIQLRSGQSVLRPSTGAIPQFSGLIDIMKVKQNEEILRNAAQQRDELTRQQVELEKTKQLLEQQLDQTDLIHGSILEFQGKPLTGLNVLQIVQELANQNKIKDKLGTTGFLIFAGSIMAGIPFFVPSFLRAFREKAWAEGTEDWRISNAIYLPNQEYYPKLQAVLNRLSREGYLKLSPGAGEGGVLDRRWLITEKTRQLLAANPQSELQWIQKFLTADKGNTVQTTEPTSAMETPKPSAPQADPMLKHFKTLLWKEESIPGAWDLLKQVATEIQGKSKVTRWFSSGISQSNLLQSAGTANADKLNRQLLALEGLGLINRNLNKTSEPEKSVWHLSEQGKRLSTFADPFAAGLLNEQILEKVIRQEITDLEASVQGKAQELGQLNQELQQATEELENIKLQQLEAETAALTLEEYVTKAPSEEKASILEQAARKGRSARTLKQMVALKTDLLTRMIQKQSLSQAHQAIYTKQVEATVQKLEEMILQARTAKVNHDLVRLSDELQQMQGNETLSGHPLIAGLESPIENRYFYAVGAASLTTQPAAGEETTAGENALNQLRAAISATNANKATGS